MVKCGWSGGLERREDVMKKGFILSICFVIISVCYAVAGQLSDRVMDYILAKHKLASKATVTGKKLKVLLTFNHDRATGAIHDQEIVKMAKSAGLKRVEFHDWSGFSKEYISTDIK